MPITSTVRHSLRFIPTQDAEQRLREVEMLLRTFVEMPLHLRTKKMMLNRALWLVVELTGDFYCRYRSAGVLAKSGERIQRDHVFTRKSLVKELLLPNPNYVAIVNRAHCCIVTDVEHYRLSRVQKNIVGWDRYTEAKVSVHDMLTYNSTETSVEQRGQTSIS